jgi:hypothetical protein
MKIQLSKITAWIQYQFTYIFDVSGFYYVTPEVMKSNRVKIFYYQTHYRSLSEEQVFEKRIQLIDDKMTRLENYARYKKWYYKVLITFICTSCFSFVLESFPYLSFPLMVVATLSFLLSLSFVFLIFFDKIKLERNLDTYRSELCSKKELLEPTRKAMNKVKPIYDEIRVKSSTEIGILYYILKLKTIADIGTATIFKKIAQRIFVHEENGLHYDLNTLKNPCVISSERSENWKMLDEFIDKLTNYTCNKKNEPEVEISPTVQEKLNNLKSQFISNGIRFIIDDEEVDLLLKLFYHHVINKHNSFLKLNEDEQNILIKLCRILTVRSIEENKRRKKKK